MKEITIISIIISIALSMIAITKIIAKRPTCEKHLLMESCLNTTDNKLNELIEKTQTNHNEIISEVQNIKETLVKVIIILNNNTTKEEKRDMLSSLFNK